MGHSLLILSLKLLYLLPFANKWIAPGCLIYITEQLLPWNVSFINLIVYIHVHHSHRAEAAEMTYWYKYTARLYNIKEIFPYSSSQD